MHDIREVVNAKNTKYRGRFPGIPYLHLPLIISTRGDLGTMTPTDETDPGSLWGIMEAGEDETIGKPRVEGAAVRQPDEGERGADGGRN